MAQNYFVSQRKMAKNIEGGELQVCSKLPLTGWKRDGYCNYVPSDGGNHLVCAKMTNEFLEFTKAQGNDLTTASNSFPGLREGDQWCICAARMQEAIENGTHPEMIKEATHEKAADWELVRNLLLFLE